MGLLLWPLMYGNGGYMQRGKKISVSILSVSKFRPYINYLKMAERSNENYFSEVGFNDLKTPYYTPHFGGPQ